MVSSLGTVFADCADFYTREICAGGRTLSFCFFTGMTDRALLGDLVLRPLLGEMRAGVFAGDLSAVLRAAVVRDAENEQTAADALLRVEVLLCVRKTTASGGEKTRTVLVNLQTGLSRDVSEPNSDVTIRGPRVGFVEDIEKNVTLLRQSLRTPDLKFLSLEVGKISHTRVMLCYLDSRADKALVSELSAKICHCDAEALAMRRGLAHPRGIAGKRACRRAGSVGVQRRKRPAAVPNRARVANGLARPFSAFYSRKMKNFQISGIGGSIFPKIFPKPLVLFFRK